jgi:hypothetical protein
LPIVQKKECMQLQPPNDPPSISLRFTINEIDCDYGHIDKSGATRRAASCDARRSDGGSRLASTQQTASARDKSGSSINNGRAASARPLRRRCCACTHCMHSRPASGVPCPVLLPAQPQWPAALIDAVWPGHPHRQRQAGAGMPPSAWRMV